MALLDSSEIQAHWWVGRPFTKIVGAWCCRCCISATLDARGMQGNFWWHLVILKGFYCEVKSMKVGDGMKHFMPLLDHWELDSQQGRFKILWRLIRRHQCCHPLTRLWIIMNVSCLMTHFIAKYVKLANIAVVHVLGSVEDERCFPWLIF